MDKLSVIIITLNEERNIGRALDSVLTVADEIIILDSFSTDDTKQICLDKGAQVKDIEWMGYAETKNHGNKLAQFDWILSLDADEALDENLQAQILEAKKGGFEGVYAINRLTNYCGKWIRHSTWYPDWKVRLFNRKACQWIGQYVHEELEFPEDIEVKRLQGNAYHYSYYTYEDHQERADKYSRLMAKKLYARGKNASWLKYIFSGIGRFITMFVLNLGILDGWKGFMIAYISGKSNMLKYRELRKLNNDRA